MCTCTHIYLACISAFNIDIVLLREHRCLGACVLKGRTDTHTAYIRRHSRCFTMVWASLLLFTLLAGVDADITGFEWSQCGMFELLLNTVYR